MTVLQNLSKGLIILQVSLCCVTGTAVAQVAFDTVAVADQILPALVEIKGESITGQSGGGGSGFVVTPDGKIVTCLHVIKDLKLGSVRLSGGEIFDTFTVLAFDERRDLAIIKVPGFDLPTVSLGNSDDVKTGEPVMLLGSPHGLEGTLTTGIVSAVRELPSGVKTIQTDAAANPGNSGGPMANLEGEAIGVIDSGRLDSENLNFAIPINYIRGMLTDVQSPKTLDEMRSSLSGTANFFDRNRGSTEVSFPIEIRIKHRHAWSGYRHATLILKKDSIEFDELESNSHDFTISPDKVIQFNSSYPSRKGNPSYTIQFTEKTKAGDKISIETDLISLETLVWYLKNYCPNVLFQN